MSGTFHLSDFNYHLSTHLISLSFLLITYLLIFDKISIFLLL